MNSLISVLGSALMFGSYTKMVGLAKPFALSLAAFPLLWVTGGVRADDGRGLKGLRPSGTARVATVIDGDSLRLANGDRLRLAGIQAPRRAWQGRRRNGKPIREAAWPLARDAADALRKLIGGKPVTLYVGGRPLDRYGRRLAHLRTSAGKWVQGEMLRGGHARVATWSDNRALAQRMLRLESAARRARRGIWAHRFYRVRTHDQLRNDLNSFQIVKGRVRGVTLTRRQAYLNFGENWRRDFTVAIAPRDLRSFRRAKIDLRKWEGKQVRVRGWVFWRNGPMIRATHPEQIEVLQ